MRLYCHTVAAAANNCSVIDCELSNLKVRSRAELASRPTPSHLFHFSLLPLSITSLTPTLPFLSFTLSVPLAAHNPPHIHPHLLNQISISIQLWVFPFKSAGAGAADPPAWLLYSPRTLQLAAARLMLHLHTDRLHPSLCLPVFYLLSPCYRRSVSHKQRAICTQRCTIFFFR